MTSQANDGSLTSALSARAGQFVVANTAEPLDTEPSEDAAVERADPALCDAEAPDSADPCEIVTEITADEGVPASEADLAADGELVSDRGMTLAAAAKKRKIYYKTWKQARRSPARVWQERHTGLFYFDGKDVWVRPHRGNEGYHRCGDNYGIGYEITITECSLNWKWNTNGTLALQQWDIFKVHVATKHGPVAFTHKMHVNTYKSGTVTFWQ